MNQWEEHVLGILVLHLNNTMLRKSPIISNTSRST